MSDTMQAIEIVEPGGPEVLQLATCEIPEPGEHDVLIRVHAAGVNRPDVLQRQGLYPLPPDASPLPGLEVAGEVTALGAKASVFKVGDRVMALTHGGGYAEYCLAHETHCLPVPQNLSDAEAAAIPETFFTVYYNVFTRGALASGETLLVHGGSSGIGTTAIQLAKAHGCKVLVTAGSDEKCRFCLDLGADVAINYRDDDWDDKALEAGNGTGPDVILDMVAGSYMQRNINILARDGRYVIIAFLQGPTAELNLRAVLGKRLTITGSTLRPQSVEEKAEIAMNLRNDVLPMLESGKVKPIIFDSFPLAEASRAHEMMESSRHMGKIVLQVT
jgi:NADPH2:quinone reductase